MTEYIANRYTSIFPFGLIAKGEKLRPEHIKALGEKALDDLVSRGLLKRIGGPAVRAGANIDEETGDDEDGGESAADIDEETGDDEDGGENAADIDEEAEDEAEQDDAPEDEMAGLDDLMDEAEPEAAPAVQTEEKPKGRRRK